MRTEAEICTKLKMKHQLYRDRANGQKHDGFGAPLPRPMVLFAADRAVVGAPVEPQRPQGAKIRVSARFLGLSHLLMPKDALKIFVYLCTAAQKHVRARQPDPVDRGRARTRLLLPASLLDRQSSELGETRKMSPWWRQGSKDKAIVDLRRRGQRARNLAYKCRLEGEMSCRAWWGWAAISAWIMHL